MRMHSARKSASWSTVFALLLFTTSPAERSVWPVYTCQLSGNAATLTRPLVLCFSCSPNRETTDASSDITCTARRP